jgi:hypothetical protein
MLSRATIAESDWIGTRPNTSYVGENFISNYIPFSIDDCRLVPKMIDRRPKLVAG